jgi:hypothetical protein
VGLNLTQGMDVCVRLFRLCVVLCVGSGIATGCSPVQGVVPTMYRIMKLKSGHGPTKRCRAIIIIIIRYSFVLDIKACYAYC